MISLSTSFRAHVHVVFFLIAAQLSAESVDIIGGVGSEPESSPESNESDIPVLFENAPDNSAGFQIFSKRIPPLPANALPATVTYRNGTYDRQYMMGGRGIHNHWAAEAEDGSSVVVSYTQTFTEGVKIAKPAKNMNRMTMTPAMMSASLAVQSYHTELVIKDVFGKLSLLNTDNGWEARSLMSKPGELMLLAVRLHQAGETDAANQLAAFLFEEIGDKKQVLMAGLSSITDVAYEDLLRKLRETSDVDAFVTASESLLAEQGKFWRHSPTLAELLPVWKKAASLPADFVPELPGVTLTEAQKALYHELAGNPKALRPIMNTLQHMQWLLAPKGMIEDYSRNYGMHVEEEDGDTSSPKKTILAFHEMGAEAIPVLAVMLQDPRFSPVDANNFNISRHSFGMGSSQEAPLPQPRGIKEEALGLLNSIDPGDGFGTDSNRPEDIVNSALAFAESIKGKSREEIALVYLNSASEWDRPEEALYTLLGSKDPAQRKLAEDYIRNSESPENFLNMVIEYTSYREEAGKDLLRVIKERFNSPEMKERYGMADGINSYFGRQLKQIDKLLETEQPEETTDKPTLAQTLDAWIEEKDLSNSPKVEAIFEAAKSETDLEFQKQIATRIMDADSLILQQTLLRLTQQVIMMGGVSQLDGMDMMGGSGEMAYYMEPERGSEPEADPVETEGEGESAEDNLYGWIPSVWLPLLEKQDTLTEQYRMVTVASSIAMTEFQDMGINAYALFQIGIDALNPDHRKTLLELTKTVMDMTVDEEEIMKSIPSADDLSEERRIEITTLLNGGDPAVVRKLILGASIPERMFLFEASQEPAVYEREALWAALTPDRKRYTASPDADGTDLPGIKPGDSIDLDYINQLLAHAQAEALAGKNGMILLSNRPMYGGTQVTKYTRYLSSHRMREKGMSIEIYLGDIQAGKQLGLEEKVSLTKPTKEEKEQDGGNDLLSLMGGGEETSPLLEISIAVDDYLNKPIPLPIPQGNFMITYCGTPLTED